MDLSLLPIGAAVLAELLLVVLLTKKHAYKLRPAFFAYICWGFLSDVGLYAAAQTYSQAVYFQIYLGQLVVDSAMMFAVLVELMWSLLRPIRSLLPKHTWLLIALLIVAACFLIWPLAGWTLPPHVNWRGIYLFRMQRTFGILRVAIFLVMAGFSQALSIGWRSRELQIATGLGMYSLVSLAVTVLHTYQLVGAGYHWLDLAGAMSYVVVLFYWLVSFASKAEDRQEFTPQMRTFLLAAAHMSRSARVALVSNRRSGGRNNG
jgi:hypothetical protein